MGVAGLAVLGMTATLAGALAGSAVAQAPDAGCALPSEPVGLPAAIDTAISGPADKDRACMKALLIPEARMMFVSLGAGCALQRSDIMGRDGGVAADRHLGRRCEKPDLHVVVGSLIGRRLCRSHPTEGGRSRARGPLD